MNSFTHRIDTYISKSENFQNQYWNIRQLIHEQCPHCNETIKWGFPHFEYRGEILCSMAAFKQHCAFGFWKEELMVKSQNLMTDNGKTAMGDFGKIKTLLDLLTKIY
ncbi:MAG: DUF1801 domain-containing protein [Saprospiraceae bacterium]|nr:DUF1801 domain-containing protein [Saprospiraceae bacterium]MBK8483184.1 DUF1801 domain-containing protein [Saprospiraceae bacterium]MBK9729483.1 DUF1801 domain-containing protein [Saprospiraceae bacterium]